MKLKGLMLLLVAIFALGVLVAGCGDDNGGDDDPGISIDTTDGVSSEELEDAADEAQQSITEALDDPDALEECKQGAEALSGDAEEQALDACEQVFGGS